MFISRDSFGAFEINSLRLLFFSTLGASKIGAIKSSFLNELERSEVAGAQRPEGPARGAGLKRVDRIDGPGGWDEKQRARFGKRKNAK